MHMIETGLGHDYGVGFDSVSGALRGDAVVRTPPTEVTDAAGQNVVFTMEQIETTEQLSDSLSTSAALSVRFGLLNGSASAKFTQSTAINSYSLYLLLSVAVTNAFRQMRDVRLNDEAASLWRSGRSDEFLARYGDEYVHGMLTGGLYYAVLQIDTESEEEKENLSVEMKVGLNAGIGGFSAKAQFEQMVSRLAAKKALKVHHMQIGGADSSVEITAESMIQKATEFPPSVAGPKAAPFNVLTKEYKTVSNLPDTPNRFDLLHAADVLEECGRLRLQYLGWINDIEYILAHPHQFVWTNEKNQARQLGQKLDEIRQAITALARRASQCANNVSECQMPSGEATVILDPDEMPERRRSTGSGKPKPRRFPFVAPMPLKGFRSIPLPGMRFLITGPLHPREAAPPKAVWKGAMLARMGIDRRNAVELSSLHLVKETEK